MIDREIIRGLLKIYILALAAKEEVHGLGILQRLKRLGFHVSPGTLYPTLKVLLLEKDLAAHPVVVKGKRRITYHLTSKGAHEFREVREKLRRLYREVE